MRELWNISNLDIYDLNEIDEETESGWHVIKSLNAPSDLGFGYGQKLTTYLQVTISWAKAKGEAHEWAIHH